VEQGDVEAWGWRDDMLDVFAQASIVCLPSWREGLPTVLVEAAACARPIVTCAVPGCREVVRDGDNGFLVPPRDPAALAAALGRLIGDAQLRRRMGERGRERAVAEFSLEHVVGQTLAIYERLLREAGR
jgi:glycosyltransferase involved in cell wall biosynthesis